jgi:hypothetical protein
MVIDYPCNSLIYRMMNKELLFMGLNMPESKHDPNYPIPLSTVGLDSVYRLGNLFYGREHTRRRPAQPDRGRVISSSLFCFPGTTAGSTCRHR